MRKICLSLEWGSYPIQELDSNGYIIDDINAEKLVFNDDFCEKILIMQELYNDLFINNEKEFLYIGMKKPDEVNRIKELYEEIAEKFYLKLKNKFILEISQLNIWFFRKIKLWFQIIEESFNSFPFSFENIRNVVGFCCWSERSKMV